MTDNTPAFAVDEPPEILVRTHDRYHAIIKACAGLPPVITAVANAIDFTVLNAVADAARENLILPILIGAQERIQKVVAEHKIDISGWEIIDAPNAAVSATKAAELAATGKAQVIMKGSLHTDELLSPIVSSTSGLRTGRRLSHSYILDAPGYHKLLIITDGVVNIAPDLVTKADICRNACDVWKALIGEVRSPKIAVLAAVETVNPKMQATLDAAALCKMADRGQLTGCIIDGPLAYDNAIDKNAAAEKGITSPVAGDPDILLAPEIESGNMMVKQLSFMCRADVAGLIMGARVPIILTSRADNLRARLLSCAVAVLVAQARREGRIK